MRRYNQQRYNQNYNQVEAAEPDTKIIFKAMDTDNSGQIDLYELEKTISKTDLDSSYQDIQSALEMADFNGDGELNLAEFERSMFARGMWGNFFSSIIKAVADLLTT